MVMGDMSIGANVILRRIPGPNSRRQAYRYEYCNDVISLRYETLLRTWCIFRFEEGGSVLALTHSCTASCVLPTEAPHKWQTRIQRTENGGAPSMTQVEVTIAIKEPRTGDEERVDDVLADDAPSAFVCPIGAHLMHDPVVVFGSGHTYERANIMRWFAEHDLDPKTNLALTAEGKQLVPNLSIKQLVDEYREEQKVRQEAQSLEAAQASDKQSKG